MRTPDKNKKRSKLPLSVYVRAMRRVSKAGLHIGFEYSAGLIWNTQQETYRSVNTRLRLTINRADGLYWFSNGELDHGKITRRRFWQLFKQYVHKGFVEFNNRKFSAEWVFDNPVD